MQSPAFCIFYDGAIKYARRHTHLHGSSFVHDCGVVCSTEAQRGSAFSLMYTDGLIRSHVSDHARPYLRCIDYRMYGHSIPWHCRQCDQKRLLDYKLLQGECMDTAFRGTAGNVTKKEIRKGNRCTDRRLDCTNWQSQCVCPVFQLAIISFHLFLQVSVTRLGSAAILEWPCQSRKLTWWRRVRLEAL